MGYQGWGRNRGRGFGRGAGFRRGLGQSYGHGRGHDFGMAHGPNPTPSCRRFPDRPRGWWAYPAYSNVTTTQRPQHNALEYQFARHPQQMQPPELLGYQSLEQSFTTHMNCLHYRNGFCTLRNVAVRSNGSACRSFASARRETERARNLLIFPMTPSES